MRAFPGTRTLKTFLSAARHLNFSRVAEELGMTPAAVSYQVKELEDQLGLQLFQRTSRTMHLTEAGRVLTESVSEALQSLDRGLVRARRLNRNSEQLNVTLDPEFATKWLMRRVDTFRRQNPAIDLRFDVTTTVRDFELDDVDVGIRFGRGRYPGLNAHPLFENVIIPVCSPKLLEGPKRLAEPRDLLNHTLAHIDWQMQDVRWPNWPMWMAAAGVSDYDDSRTIIFARSSEAVEAALSGEAVALADFAMVANELSEGRLVRPFDRTIALPADCAYHLVYPSSRANDPRIVSFRSWLLDEASKMQGPG